MSTGRISPVLCSFTHSSLSLAGSTFRSSWSTSSTVWNEENKNPNVKGTLQAESHCSDRQSSCGHACTASADKWELHVHETGWTRQVWMCSTVVRGEEGDLKKQRQVFCARQPLTPVLHLTPNTTALSQRAFPILQYLINGQFLIGKIYIYTPFSNSEAIQHLPCTNTE